MTEKIVIYKTGMVSHDGGETYHEPDPSDPKDAAWLERTRAALDRSMRKLPPGTHIKGMPRKKG